MFVKGEIFHLKKDSELFKTFHVIWSISWVETWGAFLIAACSPSPVDRGIYSSLIVLYAITNSCVLLPNVETDLTGQGGTEEL